MVMAGDGVKLVEDGIHKGEVLHNSSWGLFVRLIKTKVFIMLENGMSCCGCVGMESNGSTGRSKAVGSWAVHRCLIGMDESWMEGGEADAQGSHGIQGGTGWEVGFGLALGLWHECMR